MTAGFSGVAEGSCMAASADVAPMMPSAKKRVRIFYFPDMNKVALSRDNAILLASRFRAVKILCFVISRSHCELPSSYRVRRVQGRAGVRTKVTPPEI